MDYVNAFWVGGLICALVQILMEADARENYGIAGVQRSCTEFFGAV